MSLFEFILGANDSLVYVNTSRGSLFGFHVDYGNDKSQLFYGSGDVFLGIPYVLPPVGERRFKVRKERF